MNKFVVFDLDGTIALVEHRRHYVQYPRRDWTGFHAACVNDLPNLPVIECFHLLVDVGYRVEIWSGRSDEVMPQTKVWLARHGISAKHLTRMRRSDDYTPDDKLKLSWLAQETIKPDFMFDDRDRVVRAYREAGMTVFQVAPGDFDAPKTIKPWHSDPLLNIMVGPSGSGKSTWLRDRVMASCVVSSDEIRELITGDMKDQSRNEDVFAAVHNVTRERIRSGLMTYVDATNIRRKDRLEVVDLASYYSTVRYIVIDRPLYQKVRDGGWRNGVLIKGVSLIEKHDQVFRSNLRDILSGDGRVNVIVEDHRVEA